MLISATDTMINAIELVKKIFSQYYITNSFSRFLQNLVFQCHTDTIKVFEAVPNKWQNVCFSNLRAEGAFEITGKRVMGINSFVHVKSLAGTLLKIKPNIENTRYECSNTNVKPELICEGIYCVELEPNDEIVFYNSEHKPDMTIAPVESEKEFENYYGKIKS